jgi:hypothetical protein
VTDRFFAHSRRSLRHLRTAAAQTVQIILTPSSRATIAARTDRVAQIPSVFSEKSTFS